MQPNWNETENAIYKAWNSGQFDKLGTNRVCENVANKLGSTPASVRSIYARMKKYGAFPQPKEKKKYVQVSFRMSEELHLKLKEKAYKTGKSLNNLITRGVKKIL